MSAPIPKRALLLLHTGSFISGSWATVTQAHEDLTMDGPWAIMSVAITRHTFGRDLNR